jgi:hypothetical protein
MSKSHADTRLDNENNIGTSSRDLRQEDPFRKLQLQRARAETVAL